MKPKGYIVDYSNLITLDTPFTFNNVTYNSTYVTVGVAGNIVWMNSDGQLNYIDSAQIGYQMINASQIVTSGMVEGVSRTTTATNMTWFGSNFP